MTSFVIPPPISECNSMIPGHACIVYPPLQKNVRTPVHEYAGGPFEARLAPWSTPHGRDGSLRVRTHSTGQAKEGAPADSEEEMKDFTGVDP